jgi:DNA-binding MarR family transcriptional regulator
MDKTDPVAAVEAAMIAIRRRHTRRTFATESAAAKSAAVKSGAAGSAESSAAGSGAGEFGVAGSGAAGSGAGEFGVAESLQDVLDAIEAAEAGPIGVNGIATALGVDQPRASKLVAAAVSAGLVRREADQSDGRRTNLILTEAGRKQLDAVHTYRRTRFATAMHDWTPTEKATFATLLTRFQTALDR